MKLFLRFLCCSSSAHFGFKNLVLMKTLVSLACVPELSWNPNQRLAGFPHEFIFALVSVRRHLLDLFKVELQRCWNPWRQNKANKEAGAPASFGNKRLIYGSLKTRSRFHICSYWFPLTGLVTRNLPLRPWPRKSVAWDRRCDPCKTRCRTDHVVQDIHNYPIYIYT